jgi:hypothetical protein
MLKTDVNFFELRIESAVGVLCWAYRLGGLAAERDAATGLFGLSKVRESDERRNDTK